MENNGGIQHDLDRTSYLFLLIGTNPLPNYVAAKLLWAREEKDAKLYFVYTKDTKKYVDTLIPELALRVCENLVLIDVEDESDTKKIYDMVRAEVQKLKNNAVTDEKIGLNYTGGTKTMAVHAYRAIRELAEEAQKTYLDARSLSMVIEKEGEKDERIPTRDLLDMNIDTFLALHEYEYETSNGKQIKPQCANDVKFPELVSAIVDRDLTQAISDWAFSHYRVGIIDNNKLTKSQKRQAKSNLELPLPKELGNFYEGCSTIGEYSNKHNLTPTDVCQFFEGKWLEAYVLLSLNDFTSDINGYSTGANLRAKPPLGVNFELDDFAIKGYQLFAISCKMDTAREKLKLALFEVFVRARQIGGDEARVALVCRIKDAKCLQDELTQNWNLPEGMVRVFGIDDLPKLSEELEKWINNQ